MWQICRYTLKPGEKRQVILEPGVLGYELPATLIYGAEPGPTILMTAGIHGLEFPATAAVMRLAAQIDPNLVHGRIILMPCVNVTAFLKENTRTVPEDGFDMNADFPGKAGGTLGQCLADFFVRELIPQADFVMDMHSGGKMEPLSPCVFVPDTENPRVAELSMNTAMALNIPVLIPSKNRSGLCGYTAHQMGIPSMLVERGCCEIARKDWIREYMEDMFRVLAYMGIYPMSVPCTIESRRIYYKSVYLEADQAGVWLADVEEGQQIHKGQRLGRLTDFFGNVLAEYYAEGDGEVYYYTAGLTVRPGSPLVAYGLKESMKQI